MMESLATSLKGLLGPDVWSVVSFVYWQIFWPLISQPSMHWVYLLSSLLLGCIFLIVAAAPQRLVLRSLPGELFPRVIWSHASTNCGHAVTGSFVGRRPNACPPSAYRCSSTGTPAFFSRS